MMMGVVRMVPSVDRPKTGRFIKCARTFSTSERKIVEECCHAERSDGSLRCSSEFDHAAPPGGHATSDTSHAAPSADQADLDADGGDCFVVVGHSAVLGAPPSTYHFDSDGLVGEADDVMCEAYDLVCDPDDLVDESGKDLSVPFVGVSESVGLVGPSVHSVADPFAALCESDAAVAESGDVRGGPGGNVGDSDGCVAGSVEDVGVSDGLVGLPDKALRDPQNASWLSSPEFTLSPCASV